MVIQYVYVVLPRQPAGWLARGGTVGGAKGPDSRGMAGLENSPLPTYPTYPPPPPPPRNQNKLASALTFNALRTVV